MGSLIEIKVQSMDPDPSALEVPRDLLRGGGVGVIPTDTVYGIVASAMDESAVERVIKIKERPPGKPFPILISDMSDLESLGVSYGERHRLLMERFWPGGLTLVLPRSGGPALPFQGEHTIAVRIPAHPVTLWLLRHVGALVAPSANIAGGDPTVVPDGIARKVRSQVDFIVEAGPCPGGRESSIVDLSEGLRVVREGAISTEELERALSRRPPHCRGRSYRSPG